MAMQRTACTRWTYRADDAGFAWGDCPRPRPGCTMDAGPWPADPHDSAPDVEEGRLKPKLPQWCSARLRDDAIARMSAST